MERTSLSGGGGERTAPPTPWSVTVPVRNYMWGARIAMSFSVFFVLVSLVALAYLVTGALRKGEISTPLLITAFVFSLLSFLLRGWSFKLSHYGAFKLETILRRNLVEKANRAPLGAVEELGAAKLTRILTDDVHALHGYVADSTPLVARSYVSPVLTAILMFFLSWRLALVALVVLMAGLVIMMLNMSKNKEITRAYYESQESIEKSVVEFVQAMPVVRTFDSGHASFGRYEAALRRYLDVVSEWYRRMGASQRLVMVLLNPMPTLLALLGAGLYFHSQGSLSLENWIACLLIGTGVAESMAPYVALMHIVEYSKMAIVRIDEVMSLPEEPEGPAARPTNDASGADNARAEADDGGTAAAAKASATGAGTEGAKTPALPKDASIVFENVSFSYPGRDERALKNASFVIDEGSFTALVGDSGAGKTTIANLITRFYDVDEGSIKLGGVDIRSLDREDLMRRISVVFQDNFLFSGSIRDNITLGLEGISDEEMIEAAKKAMAHDFIMSFDHGYDSLVGERGTLMSGGQKQRITIARAFLQNRPVLLLDEATAFSDPENEAQLLKAIRNLMKDKTVVMIAHRLSSIRNADKILYFRRGELVESGAHEELVARGGAYKELNDAYETVRDWRLVAEADRGEKGAKHVET